MDENINNKWRDINAEMDMYYSKRLLGIAKEHEATLIMVRDIRASYTKMFGELRTKYNAYLSELVDGMKEADKFIKASNKEALKGIEDILKELDKAIKGYEKVIESAKSTISGNKIDLEFKIDELDFEKIGKKNPYEEALKKLREERLAAQKTADRADDREVDKKFDALRKERELNLQRIKILDEVIQKYKETAKEATKSGTSEDLDKFNTYWKRVEELYERRKKLIEETGDTQYNYEKELIVLITEENKLRENMSKIAESEAKKARKQYIETELLVEKLKEAIKAYDAIDPEKLKDATSLEDVDSELKKQLQVIENLKKAREEAGFEDNEDLKKRIEELRDIASKTKLVIDTETIKKDIDTTTDKIRETIDRNIDSITELTNREKAFVTELNSALKNIEASGWFYANADLDAYAKIFEEIRNNPVGLTQEQIDKMQEFLVRVKEFRDISIADPDAPKLVDEYIDAAKDIADALRLLQPTRFDKENLLPAQWAKAAQDLKTANNDLQVALTDLSDKAKSILESQSGTTDESETYYKNIGEAIKAIKKLEEQYDVLIKKMKEANDAFPSGGNPNARASGGYMPRGTDTVPAMLTPGEFVVNANATKKYLPQLLAMNTGQYRPNYYAAGGQVDVGGINVTVNGGSTSEQTVREIVSGINREIRRGRVRLQS